MGGLRIRYTSEIPHGRLSERDGHYLSFVNTIDENENDQYDSDRAAIGQRPCFM